MWTDLLAEWVMAKPKNSSMARKGELEPVEQEPFGILNNGPHVVTSFAKLQWPELASKAESEQDKGY